MIPMRVPIDVHKGLTGPLVAGLMAYQQEFGLAAWVYLALHGSYGLMWVAKSAMFPDPAWERPVPPWKALGVFLALGLYWIPGIYCVFAAPELPAWRACVAVALVVLGTFLHFGSDAQKFYTLRVRRGLITDGFFARTRNPNYLGEMMIYTGFAVVPGTWWAFLPALAFWVILFVPNMLRKDRSMSRYPEWADYTARSGLLLPKWFGRS